jgi:TP901 family phage tail tape measure protein
MADRTVKVTLTAAVNGYLSGLEQARKATKKTSDEGKKDLEAQGRAFGELGTIALGVGVLAAAGIALAVARFAEFDQAISNVKAATQETTENMDLLRDAALKFGASSVFTATEAANAIEELGKAGISTADILGGALEASLNLASAGELGIARAAEIAATTLKQFGLAGVDAARVADILAAGAGKSLGSVEDLAQGLKFVGPVAAAMGVSLEETTGVLALFAEQGIIGEQAGTALRGMLSSLTSPSKAAADEMEKLGIQLYDQSGAFLGVENAAGQLNSAFGGLTAEQRDFSLGVLFGNQQITAARVLYASGAEGVAKWSDAVSDSGYAAQVARDRLDNLKGDVEALGGAFDTYLIRTGSGANEVLRGLTQSLTFLVEGLGGMPEEALNVGLAFGVVATAMLLVGGSALVAIPKFAALKATVEASGISMKVMAIRTLAIGGALGLATIAIGFFVSQAAEAKGRVDSYGDSLDEATKKTTDFTRELVKTELTAKGMFNTASTFDAAETLGISLDLVTDAALGNKDAIDEVTAALAERQKIMAEEAEKGYNTTYNYGEQERAITNIGEAIVGTSGEISEAQRIQEQKTKADKKGINVTETATDRYIREAESVQGLTDDLTTLIDTINESNNVGQDAVSTNAAYQSSLADVTDYVAKARKGVEGFTLGWDANTVAGSGNREMLSGLAQDSQAAAAAQLALDGNTDAYLETVSAGNKTMYDQAIAFGASTEEARIFADSVYAIPSEAEVKLIADTAKATRKIEEFKRILAMPNVVVTAEMRAQGGYYGNRAEGGAISGPGSGTSDTAGVFRLSNGEHVLTAADVQAMGGQAGVYAFRNQLKGYATGGAVQYAAAGSTSGGFSSTTSGDTFQVSFQLAPVAGRSLSDQAFEAARRLKLRR